MSASRLPVILVFAALLVPAAACIAQNAEADTAMVMLGVAESLRARGELDEADHIFELIRRLYPESEAARLAALALSEPAAPKKPGSGNTEFIVFNTFYGAGLGVIIPGAFGADGPEPYGAGLLLGAPVGYGLSRLYASRYPLTKGQARAMTFGTWWGAFQALGWREVLDIAEDIRTECFGPPDEIQCFEVAYQSDRAPFTSALVGGLSGLAVGAILGRSVPIEGSTALIVNLAGVWGTWFGGVLSAQLHSDNTNDFGAEDNNDDVVATILIAGDVGVLAGAFGGPSLHWTTADAWTVHLAGIVGIVGGFGIDLLASVDESDTALLIPGLTSAAALAISSALVSKRPAIAGESSPPRYSVLNFANGRWSLGMPTPVPTTIPIDRDGRRRHQPAARISLLRMNW